MIVAVSTNASDFPECEVETWSISRAQTILRQVLLSSGSLVLPGPHLFIANGRSIFDDDGSMIDSDLRSRLENLLASFADWIRLVGTAPA